MAISAALIACANGLGHVRRVLLIACELNKAGVEVTVFAPRRSVQTLKTSIPLEVDFCVSDFDTLTSATALRDSDSRVLSWEQRLPAIDSFDLVLSDNLPEILALRPDAWLSGNFFWHEVLPDISSSYRQRAEHLLGLHEPKLLTYGGFSVIDDVENLRITECAIPNPTVKKSGVLRDSLLITCGTGGEAGFIYREFVNNLTEDAIKPFSQVFVEPNLISQDCKKWMYPASFTTIMFSQILVAICRPGFGILSDCLLHKIQILKVFEQGNLEMVRNAEVLESVGLGKTFRNMPAALSFARQYAGDPWMQEAQNRCAEKFIERAYPNAADVLLG